MDCIFCKIGKHEMKSNILYEDDEMVVFPDIHPRSSLHLLIVPKKHISDLCDFSDFELWSKILKVAKELISKNKLKGKGFRLVINGGGAQIIDHLHVHLLGEISVERNL